MMSKLTVTVLVENTAPAGGIPLAAEHGLSLWLEYGEARILLDAGQSDAFARNADALGIALSQADFAVLSHAHYDHADGLAAFFARNAAAPLYLQKSCVVHCFSGQGAKQHFIGIRPGLLDAADTRLRFVSGLCSPAPGVWLVPHSTPGLARIGADTHLYRTAYPPSQDAPGALLPDDFLHEQSLVLEVDDGLVVLNSCSHGGAANILHEVSAAFPGRPVVGFVGGLHLMRTPEPAVRAYAQTLRDGTPARLYTGHCTGEPACAILKEALGDRFAPLTTGARLFF